LTLNVFFQTINRILLLVLSESARDASSRPSGLFIDEGSALEVFFPESPSINEVSFQGQSIVTRYENEDFLFLFHETENVPEDLEVRVYPQIVEIGWRKTRIDDKALVSYFESVGIPYRNAMELCLQGAANCEYQTTIHAGPTKVFEDSQVHCCTLPTKDGVAKRWNCYTITKTDRVIRKPKSRAVRR
jgi:hypothetical protein